MYHVSAVISDSLCCGMAVHVGSAEGFHIDLEDFLMGLLNLASELVGTRIALGVYIIAY